MMTDSPMFAILAPGALALALVIGLGVLLLGAIAFLLYLILRNISTLHGDAAEKLTHAVAELAEAQKSLAVTVEQLRAAHEQLAKVVEELRVAHEKLAKMEVSLVSGRVEALELKLAALAAGFEGMPETMKSILATISG